MSGALRKAALYVFLFACIIRAADGQQTYVCNPGQVLSVPTGGFLRAAPPGTEAPYAVLCTWKFRSARFACRPSGSMYSR